MESKLKKWIVNWDFLTLVLGGFLVYFAEDIVTVFYPLDPIPAATISLLYYFVFFTIATFWIFKGVAYWTIKISWNSLYEYFEEKLDTDIDHLTSWQRAVISLSFYLGLAFLLAIIFLATVTVL